MQNYDIAEKWNEIRYLLSKKINSKEKEIIFEQSVVAAFMQLGWSHIDNIRQKRKYQLGTQSIETDIEICESGDDRNPLIVVEVKRPGVDIAQEEYRKQLESYIKQTGAKFGFLVGSEIHVYYNNLARIILIDKIQYDDRSTGELFVENFNKQCFLAKKYADYVESKINEYKANQIVKKFKAELVSGRTVSKVQEFLINEFSKKFIGLDISIIEETIKNTKIDIQPSGMISSIVGSLSQTSKNRKSKKLSNTGSFSLDGTNYSIVYTRCSSF